MGQGIIIRRRAIKAAREWINSGALLKLVWSKSGRTVLDIDIVAPSAASYIGEMSPYTDEAPRFYGERFDRPAEMSCARAWIEDVIEDGREEISYAEQQSEMQLYGES